MLGESELGNVRPMLSRDNAGALLCFTTVVGIVEPNTGLYLLGMTPAFLLCAVKRCIAKRNDMDTLRL